MVRVKKERKPFRGTLLTNVNDSDERVKEDSNGNPKL